MKERSSFWVRAASVAAVLLWPGCSLDRSLDPPPVTSYSYRLYASIRSADGLVTPVSFGDAELDSSTDASAPLEVTEVGGSAEATDAAVLDWWKRYLADALARGGSASGFQMRFGAGPWCLTVEPVFDRIGPPVNVYAPLPSLATDPLPLCAGMPLPPQPTGCEVRPDTPPALVEPMEILSFSPLPVYQTSAEQLVQLTNGGAGRLCLVVRGPSGTDADDFFLNPRPATPADCLIDTAEELAAGRVFLEPGESCSLRVRFQPTAGGQRGAQVTVASNDPVMPNARIAVIGTGEAGHLVITDPPTPPDAPLCVPAVGGCHERRVSITNTGPGTVSVRSWAGDGVWTVDAFSPVPPSADLVPGAFISAHIRSCLGVTPGRLSVAGNADNTPFTIDAEPATTCP